MRVLVDTDPGLGLRFADVDDGLALFLMLNNDIFEIEGITVVFGNTPVEKGYLLVKKYLKLCNKLKFPHFKGASNRKEYGRLTEASRYLVDMVKEYPNDLTLITLGPLTNVATALQFYPSFLDELKKIIIMGGTLSPQTAFNPIFRKIDRRFFDKLPIKELVAEFNFFNDPPATKRIIEAKTTTPRIIMGLDVCCQLVFKLHHILELQNHTHPITQFIVKHIQHWYKLWLLNGLGGFFPFDTFCPIYLINPSLFSMISLPLKVEIDKLGGKLIISAIKKQEVFPLYGTGFVNENAKRDFMEILLTNLKY
ncbi:MAG: nucleoside hydrolase [Promethearchaeia archaeon]